MAAVVALIVALVGNAEAGQRPAATPLPVGKLTPYHAVLSVAPGKTDLGTAFCPAGQRPVSGGFDADRGNFFYVVGATIVKSGDRYGYGVEIVVPNAIAEPGVLTARIEIMAYCAPRKRVFVMS